MHLRCWSAVEVLAGGAQPAAPFQHRGAFLNAAPEQRGWRGEHSPSWLPTPSSKCPALNPPSPPGDRPCCCPAHTGSLPPLRESYQASGLAAFEEMQPEYNLLAGVPAGRAGRAAAAPRWHEWQRAKGRRALFTAACAAAVPVCSGLCCTPSPPHPTPTHPHPPTHQPAVTTPPAARRTAQAACRPAAV